MSNGVKWGIEIGQMRANNNSSNNNNNNNDNNVPCGLCVLIFMLCIMCVVSARWHRKIRL